MVFTHKQQFNIRHKFDKDESHSKTELSKLSKINIKILDEVYDRGIGAYKTNPTSVRMKDSYKKNIKAPMSKKLSPEQWAMARVYAFINKIEKGIKLNHDIDLMKKI